MNLNLYTSAFCSLLFYKKRGNEKGKGGKVKIYHYPFSPDPYLFFIEKVCEFKYIFQLVITSLPILPRVAHRVLQGFSKIYQKEV